MIAATRMSSRGRTQPDCTTKIARAPVAAKITPPVVNTPVPGRTDPSRSMPATDMRPRNTAILILLLVAILGASVLQLVILS